MRRIRHFKIKMAASAAFLLYLILIAVNRTPCLIKRVFGIPCPTCGMTRAWIAALHLDFAAAFSMHPMFWSVPVLYLYVLYDGELFQNKIANWTVFGAILFGYLINYIFMLIHFFSGV